MISRSELKFIFLLRKKQDFMIKITVKAWGTTSVCANTKINIMLTCLEDPNSAHPVGCNGEKVRERGKKIRLGCITENLFVSTDSVQRE